MKLFSCLALVTCLAVCAFASPPGPGGPGFPDSMSHDRAVRPVNDVGKPISADVVIPFKDPKLVPALHTSVWQKDLSGKVGAELWAPVVEIESPGVALGSAFVLSYSTGGYAGYLGLIGDVRQGEIPHSGIVFGFKARF